MVEAFEQHPEAEIITTFPGLGPALGARVLGEIGDDRTRFDDAEGFNAYAGTAPVSRAWGRRCAVTRRVVRDKRLGQVGYLWAFSLLTASPGARAHYDRRRDRRDSHAAASRNLANRYFGILHHCLQRRIGCNESVALPERNPRSLDSSHRAMSWRYRVAAPRPGSTAASGTACTAVRRSPNDDLRSMPRSDSELRRRLFERYRVGRCGLVAAVTRGLGGAR
jgi:hypothetical protein